jgi:hypothetical protein
MLNGPDKYGLALTPRTYKVDRSFSGIAIRKIPKLYVVVAKERVVYVGVTRQTMSSRLRYGFTATGKHGYHGYAWPHKHTQASLYVWAAHEDAGSSLLDVETIEAEVVFLVRQRTGQWPSGQTEIHFHPSFQVHRKAAAAVWKAIA